MLVISQSPSAHSVQRAGVLVAVGVLGDAGEVPRPGRSRGQVVWGCGQPPACRPALRSREAGGLCLISVKGADARRLRILGLEAALVQDPVYEGAPAQGLGPRGLRDVASHRPPRPVPMEGVPGMGPSQIDQAARPPGLPPGQCGASRLVTACQGPFPRALQELASILGRLAKAGLML